MKTLQKILIGFAVAATAVCAMAQSQDYYAEPRWININPSSGTFINQSGTGILLAVSNATPVDLKGLTGVGVIYLNVQNVADQANLAPSATINVNTSPTGTNGWVSLNNYSLASSLTQNYTNYIGTTNSQYVTSQNTYFVPGTLSNAVPSINLFAGQFYTPSAFTNTGSVATGITNGTYVIGFNPNDQNRYLQVQLLLTGTNATWTSSAILVARPENPRYY